MLKTTWDRIPAGGAIKLPNGRTVHKCADQWNHHHTDGMTVFDPSTGRLEHASWYFLFDYTGYEE